jgi:hypothetical protein
MSQCRWIQPLAESHVKRRSGPRNTVEEAHDEALE